MRPGELAGSDSGSSFGPRYIIDSVVLNSPSNINPSTLTSSPTNVVIQNENDKNEGEKNDVQGKGSKKQKSIACDHFTKFPLAETKGEQKVKCNRCHSIYSCHPNKYGTNSMIKHLHRSHKWLFNKVRKKGTLHGYMPRIGEGEEDGSSMKLSDGHNIEDLRKSVAEFVISDEMPFKVVEGRGFRRMLSQDLPYLL